MVDIVEVDEGQSEGDEMPFWDAVTDRAARARAVRERVASLGRVQPHALSLRSASPASVHSSAFTLFSFNLLVFLKTQKQLEWPPTTIGTRLTRTTRMNLRIPR